MKATLTAWFGILIAASALAADQTWQVTLRSELRVATSNFFCYVPMGGPGRMHYNVPAAAAKVLESRKSEELLPFLSDLRARSEPPAASVVDQWALIVRQGLRGTPSWVPSMSTTQKLGVFEYTSSLRKQAHDPKKP